MRGSSSDRGYNSLRDVHLAHYFSRADVLGHLLDMGLVTRSGEVVPESEWRRLHFKEQREAREREKEEHRRRLQEAEDVAKRRIKAKIRRREVRRSLRAMLENEWRRLYVLTQQREQQDIHDIVPAEAKPPSGKACRTREVRQPSTSESDFLHFDIEWNFRPVSVSTEEARSSTGTAGASNGSSDVPGHLNGTSGGPPDVTPNRVRQPKFQLAGNSRGRAGQPYVASLGPNPSPRFLHILRPTNSCKEVWMRLCPPQPESSRLRPTPQPQPPPRLRLVYAGGAPCPTPTQLLLRQQPAGAHNVTIFHGEVSLGDEIEVTSLRRTNFPFSLTIYENGVATGRLSACCEHRYAAGSRLGGRSGHLRVLEIVGGEQCLRCQLRLVEMRHKQQKQVRRRHQPITTTAPPLTPPHDSGSEDSTRSEESEDLTSDSSDREPEADTKTRTSSTSSDIESVILQDRLDVRREDLAQGRRSRRVSGGSCNGPSDLEVAAALGVDTRSLERTDERENGTPKDTSTSNTNSSSSKARISRNSSGTTINGRVGHSSSRNRRCRWSTSNEEKSRRDSRGSPRRPFQISSSLDGQTAVGRRNSILELSSRPGSSRSKRRFGSNGSQQSRREIWQNSDKVDSFYSQQKFTSSSGSDVHDAPGSATDVSYGSSWEEEDEDQDDEIDNLEDDEADETKEGECDIEKRAESHEKNLGDDKSDRDSVSDGMENKEDTSEDNVEEEEDVDSEHEEEVESDGARDEVEEKSAENSISEDVGEESDIVHLSSSETEIVEEDEDKGRSNINDEKV